MEPHDTEVGQQTAEGRELVTVGRSRRFSSLLRFPLPTARCGFRLRQFSSYCGGGSFYLLIKHVSYLTFGSSCIKISRSVSLGDKITGCGSLIRAHPLVSTCACAVRCSIYLVDAANTPSILVPMAN